tara:strand:- start:4494 stop:4655 length:162 start_codon:yes stop_codon:yes gene_type:complete
MGKLSEEIGRIVNLLEDAKEEQDWSTIQNIIDDLDDIYDRLDREENGFNYINE